VGKGRGFTLAELMIALVVAGLAMGMAVPRLEGVLRRARTVGALNRLATDLEFTRMAAVRSGAGATLRFVTDRHCPARGGGGYVVRVRGDLAVLRRSTAPDELPVCYQVNADSIAFDSRGLLAPFNNRTVRVVLDGRRDSLTVSVMGRVYRRW
jgi:prepilin-type N-terminal cleavage/methylation domain-containing protein